MLLCTVDMIDIDRKILITIFREKKTLNPSCLMYSFAIEKWDKTGAVHTLYNEP